MRTILVVDDDADDREAHSRALHADRRFSYRIVEARDADECLDCLDTLGLVDCVLLDYSLPGHDGLTVLRRILDRDRFQAVVMVTGQGDEGLAVEALRHGAQDYISKGVVSPEVIERSVSNAIDRSAMARRIALQQESLQTFADVLVHDLRSPLSVIQGAIGLLADGLPGDVGSENRELLDGIARGAEQMDRLILSLRAMSVAENTELEFETVDLGGILDQVREALQVDLQRANARLTGDAGLPAVRGSAPLLAQLLQNLVANGIKYNRSGAPHVHVAAEETPETWDIRVTDNGIGIEEKDFARIFEPFKRLHGETEFAGTGLGLATCRRIAERHFGKLSLQSAAGQGTTFTLTLRKGRQPLGRVLPWMGPPPSS